MKKYVKINDVCFISVLREIISVPEAKKINHPNVVNNDICAKQISGTLLKKGETFSFDETVGERTKERGFTDGFAYVNGRVVSDLGGGICFSASVLFSAIFKAGLEIVERRPHSRPVSYLPGVDAMIWAGNSDLKFKNNLDTDVFIHMYIRPKEDYNEFEKFELVVNVFFEKGFENNFKIFKPKVTITEKVPYEIIRVNEPEKKKGFLQKGLDGYTCILEREDGYSYVWTYRPKDEVLNA